MGSDGEGTSEGWDLNDIGLLAQELWNSGETWKKVGAFIGLCILHHAPIPEEDPSNTSEDLELPEVLEPTRYDVEGNVASEGQYVLWSDVCHLFPAPENYAVRRDG